MMVEVKKLVLHLYINFLLIKSKKLISAYLIMIIPSRWYWWKGLDVLREAMLTDDRIGILIYDFPKRKGLFSGNSQCVAVFAISSWIVIINPLMFVLSIMVMIKTIEMITPVKLELMVLTFLSEIQG